MSDLSKIKAQSLTSVEVTVWKTTTKNIDGEDVRRDCFWNIAKEQANQQAQKENRTATDADIANIMNEIIEYNNALAEKNGGKVTKDMIIHDGDKVYLPLKYAMDEVSSLVNMEVTNTNANLDVLADYKSQLESLKTDATQDEIESLDELIASIDTKLKTPPADPYDPPVTDPRDDDASIIERDFLYYAPPEGGDAIIDDTDIPQSGDPEEPLTLSSYYGLNGVIGTIGEGTQSTSVTYQQMDELIDTLRSTDNAALYASQYIEDINTKYISIIQGMKDNKDNPSSKQQLLNIYRELKDYKSFIDAVNDYTKGGNTMKDVVLCELMQDRDIVQTFKDEVSGTGDKDPISVAQARELGFTRFGILSNIANLEAKLYDSIDDISDVKRTGGSIHATLYNMSYGENVTIMPHYELLSAFDVNLYISNTRLAYLSDVGQAIQFYDSISSLYAKPDANLDEMSKNANAYIASLQDTETIDNFNKEIEKIISSINNFNTGEDKLVMPVANGKEVSMHDIIRLYNKFVTEVYDKDTSGWFGGKSGNVKDAKKEFDKALLWYLSTGTKQGVDLQTLYNDLVTQISKAK